MEIIKLIIMTLKELLTQVGFDELLPYLEKHEPEHLDNLYDFREAYDILRNMKPANNFEGKIFVEWHGGEWEDEEKWIGVSPMHDCTWEEDLAKEIVVADDVHLTLAELAMHCLWEITYWGFSPDEREETWQRKFGPKVLNNKYEIALDKLEESIWRHQTPRRLRSKGKDGRRYVTWTNARDFFNNRMNRSKRKREYRQDKREEYLRKMAARENLVRTLSAEGSSFRRNEVEFLLHVQYGRQYDYRSVTSNIENRLDYIFESMTRYQQVDLSRYNSAVIFLQFPLGKPLDELSLTSFKQRIREWLGYTDILFGSIEVETEAPDVNVTLLLSRRMEK